MRFFIVLTIFFFPITSFAQDIVDDPICFTVKNEAPYKVFGTFATAQYTTEDGTRARHRSNFRLQEKGGVDPSKPIMTDTAEFCSYGPFLPGRKLSLTLKTLVPIFSCQTRVDQGVIVIKGYRKPEGGTETWAECYL